MKSSCTSFALLRLLPVEIHIPDGKNTTSLSEVGLLLDTTNSLLEDGRDLGGSSLGIGGVESGGVDGGGCGISELVVKNKLAEVRKSPRQVDSDSGPKQLKKAESKVEKAIQLIN